MAAFAAIAVVGVNVTSYLTATAANTTYSYRVRAYTTNSDSSYSNTAVVTTLAAPGRAGAV